MICKSCGEVISGTGRTCGACGTWNSQNSHASQSVEIGQTDFLAEIKRLTKSFSFILGCLLITIGTVGSIFFSFSWQNVLDIAFATVYIAALWILIFDAFSHESYAKTLTALSMFKVSVVLSMILICIVFGITGISVLFATMRGILFLLILAIVGGIGYLIIKHYFLALLKVLDGIRERITTGKYSSLEGLGSFLVLSYIGIGISVIAAFADMAGTFTPQSVTVISPTISVDIYGNIVHLSEGGMVINEATVTPFVFSWSVIFIIANGIGMLLCLRTLKKFE